jgi:hypothetical protein
VAKQILPYERIDGSRTWFMVKESPDMIMDLIEEYFLKLAENE